jgi:predicted lipoprotein with Yx(FWY)xxD motif
MDRRLVGPMNGRWRRRAAATLVAACAAAGLAGCGGSGGSGEALTTKELPGYGTVLATAAGQPLYMLSSDPQGSTECTGDCLAQWKPLTGEASTGDGVDGEVDSFERSDGDTQVLYNGHALYTYARGNSGVGGGAGVKWGDGTWYLVDPKGEAIKTTAAGGY